MLNYNHTPEGEEAYASFIELPFNNVFDFKLKPENTDFELEFSAFRLFLCLAISCTSCFVKVSLNLTSIVQHGLTVLSTQKFLFFYFFEYFLTKTRFFRYNINVLKKKETAR